MTFDPAVIGYEDLLTVFWSLHDPTYRGGDQYKSVIFYTTPEQQAAAERSRDALQLKLGRRVVTDILSAPAFWRAEEYHQKYYRKHGLFGCTVR